jgi:E3 ubiquitin-protein ligase TRIP12
LDGIKTASGTSLVDLYFFFTLPNYDSIELIRDGKNTQLSLDNVQEYIDLVLHSIFYDCINLQLQAFKKGFSSVLPLDSIRTFSTREEIEMMICGEATDDPEWKDFGKL